MIDLKTLDLEVLGCMDADALESLRDDARALLDRIQEQLEWWNHRPGKKLRRWQLMPSGLTFYAEALEDGVLINPALPEGFDNTDNELRSPEELARWWLRPFILVETWEDQEQLIRLHEGVMKNNLRRVSLDDYIEDQRARWYAEWPEGKRYEVCCLDGGAWDRPSDWGMFGTLVDALICVRQRCR